MKRFAKIINGSKQKHEIFKNKAYFISSSYHSITMKNAPDFFLLFGWQILLKNDKLMFIPKNTITIK